MLVLRQGIEARRTETRKRLGRVSDKSPAARRRGDAQYIGGENAETSDRPSSRQTGWRFELAPRALAEMRVGGYVPAEPEAFIELMFEEELRGARWHRCALVRRPGQQCAVSRHEERKAAPDARRA